MTNNWVPLMVIALAATNLLILAIRLVVAVIAAVTVLTIVKKVVKIISKLLVRTQMF